MSKLLLRGLDYAWGRPSIATLLAFNTAFVIRYLSNDTSGKNLTRSEAELYSRHDIPIVVVWESTAKRMRAGLEAGKVDARIASKMANDCGMPSDRPIYFACDFDATEHDQTAINAYLKGAASIIGLRRVGIYGGYYVVDRCINAGLVSWVWQTLAWSGGKIHQVIHIHQYSNGHRLDGVAVDYNHAYTSDYGQWMIGSKAPGRGVDDLPTAKEIAVAITEEGINAHGLTVGDVLQTMHQTLPKILAELEKLNAANNSG